jgi:hypothetical protein
MRLIYEARGGVSPLYLRQLSFYFYGGREKWATCATRMMRGTPACSTAGALNTSIVQTHHQGQAESDKF